MLLSWFFFFFLPSIGNCADWMPNFKWIKYALTILLMVACFHPQRFLSPLDVPLLCRRCCLLNIRKRNSNLGLSPSSVNAKLRWVSNLGVHRIQQRFAIQWTGNGMMWFLAQVIISVCLRWNYWWYINGVFCSFEKVTKWSDWKSWMRHMGSLPSSCFFY